eukprot:9006364-Pyramimonas_sp.AAC.1
MFRDIFNQQKSYLVRHQHLNCSALAMLSTTELKSNPRHWNHFQPSETVRALRSASRLRPNAPWHFAQTRWDL